MEKGSKFLKFNAGLYKMRGEITRCIKFQAKFKKSVQQFITYLLIRRIEKEDFKH
jgi:hypothetical protein